MTSMGRCVQVAKSACVRQIDGHIVGMCVCRTVAMHNQSVTACARPGNCHPVSQNPATARLPMPTACVLGTQGQGCRSTASEQPRIGVQAGGEVQEEDSAGSPGSGLRLLHADCRTSPEPQFPHQHEEDTSTHLAGLLKDTATVVYRGRLARCSAHN